MLLTEGGRIVLIDDKHEEIDALLSELTHRGIPHLYFNGTLEQLPEKPLGGVRFVFLDIELQGMRGQPNPTKASGVVAILQRIVSKDNGPYSIIFWTKHNEVIQLVLENCNRAGIPPVMHFDLEKLADEPKLAERLQEKMKQSGAFRLYVEWEDTVSNAARDFIKTFASLVNPGNNWSKETAALFYNLYATYADQNKLESEDDQFKCACHLMNRSFLDTLENLTCKDLKIPDGFSLQAQGNIPLETKAKINTSLFISELLYHPYSPGYVYEYDIPEIRDSLQRDLAAKGKTISQASLCLIIISPECDLAQLKVITVKGPGSTWYRVHRVLLGLMLPWSEHNNIRDRRDNDYRIGPIWQNGQTNELIIHFATISCMSEDKITKQPIFALKRDLFFDLQSRAANHVNRLGNYLLK